MGTNVRGVDQPPTFTKNHRAALGVTQDRAGNDNARPSAGSFARGWGCWCKAWTLPHPEGLSGKRISAPHWVDLPLRLMCRLALVVLPTLLGKLDLEDLDEETVNRLVGITWTISERVVNADPSL